MLVFNVGAGSTPGFVEVEISLQPGAMTIILEGQVQVAVRTILHGLGVSSDPVFLSTGSQTYMVSDEPSA